MKKYFFRILLIIAAAVVAPPLCHAPSLPALAAEEVKTYALITAENPYLYRDPVAEETPENRYFKLPPTYFVELLSAAAVNGFLNVKYDDVAGYVSESSVTPVDYVPRSVSPAGLSLHFSIDSPTINLRTRPKAAPEFVLAAIPASAQNVRYYNVSEGELMSGSDSWFYLSYQADGAVIRGYINSAHCVVDVAIPPENDISPIPPSDPPGNSDPGNSDPGGGEPGETKPFDLLTVLIIAAVTTPTVLAIYLLFRPRARKIPISKAPEPKPRYYIDE
jgi:hypothetical protein